MTGARRRGPLPFGSAANECELLLAVPGLGVGGTERQVTLLARGLVELDEDWASRLIIATLDTEAASAGDLPQGVRRVSFDLPRYDDPRAVPRLRRLVAEVRPRSVYTLLVPTNVAGSAALTGSRTPLVWGHRSRHLTTSWSRARVRGARAVLRLAAQRADACIVNSAAAAEFASTLPALRDRIHIVPNAVDTAVFAPRPDLRDVVRDGLGLPVDSWPVVLAVGRLVHDKDHRTLLRAFRDVHATHAAARLVVAGEGDAAQVEELSRLARELGVGEHVALIGGRSDVPRLYSAADVVVQSSRNEGSSNVIIEALASGVRTVSTDCGSARELLGADRVVAVGDAAALARVILAALRDDGSTVRGREALPTPAQLAKQTLDVIDAAHRRRARGRARRGEDREPRANGW